MIKKTFVLIIISLFQLLNAVTKIPLTDVEKSFLKKHPVIRFSPDPAFKPIEYIDQDGNYEGMSADFMKILEQELNVKFQLVKCKDWAEVIKKAKNREIDLLPAAAKTPSRKKYMNFSRTYLKFPGLIITKKSNKNIKSMKNLKNKKLAIVKGYIWQELISKDYPEIKIIPVKNVNNGLIKLTNNKVDAAIVSLPIFLNLKKTGFTNLRIAGESGYHTNLSILTRNDWPALSIIIDKALQNITKEQKTQIFQKWFGKTAMSDSYLHSIITLVLYIIGSLLIIIFIILIWNNSLKKKVKEKTKALNAEVEKLKEKEKKNFQLTQIQSKIIENTRFWISIFDKDLNVIIWNKAAELISGYTIEDAYNFPYKNLMFYREEGNIPADQVIKEIFENNINYNEHESKIITKDNQIKEMSFFSRIIKDKEKEISQLLIIGHEITQQKMLEKKTKESLEFLNFLNNLSSTLSHSYDVKEISRNAVTKLWEYFPDTFIALFLPDNENKLLISNALIGHKPDTWENGVSFPIDKSISGKSFLEKKIQYVFDLNNDSRVDKESKKKLYQQGYRTIISMPLVYNEKSFGIINIFSEKENYHIDEEKLLTIGKTIAIAIQNSILFERINQQLKQIKETKDKLEIKNQEYKDLLYYNPYGIIVHHKGIIKYCNQAFLDILEVENIEEIINKNIMPYVATEFREIVKKRIVSYEDKHVLPLEEKFISKKNNEIWLEVTGFSLANNDKLVMVKDITQRKQTEKEKEELQKHLIQNDKMDAIGLLAGGIAHDFNNFLTIISGSIDLLNLIIKDQERPKNILYTASKAVENAKNLTQQLLTFSKGGEPIKKTSSLVNIVKDTTHFVLSGTKIKPEFNIDKNIFLCKIDEGQISQVIQNIVLNARQVMPGGGIIQIIMENTNEELETKYQLEKNNYVKISIKDEGPGIPDKYLDKIFTPYFTTKKEGNGIGLALCFSIIKKHNGYLFVETKEYFGTKFIIFLPALSQGKELIKNMITQTKEDLSGKILIMDDEEMILKIAKEMLELIGFEVVTCKNGFEAVNYYEKEMLRKSPFDLVIVDLTIPGNKGGKETMQSLLEIDKNVKVIVSSGYSNSKIMANYQDYGFIDKINKPYTLDKLINVLKNVLTR